MAKNLILGLIKACWAQIWASIFFYKISRYTLPQAIIQFNLKENQQNKHEKLAKNLILSPVLVGLA